MVTYTMKRWYFLIGLVFVGCKLFHHNPYPLPTKATNVSNEIDYIYTTDQIDRWAFTFGTGKRDQQRISRILELYHQNLIVKPKDMNAAGWVLLHAWDSTSYKIAYKLASNAVDSGYAGAKLTQRAAYDHWMVAIGKSDAKVKFSYKKGEDY